MKTTTFTSTISPQLLSWVTNYANQTKKTRRDVLEEALNKYRTDEIRQRMQADFKRASKDKQTIELAEWGMDDYHEILTS